MVVVLVLVLVGRELVAIARILALPMQDSAPDYDLGASLLSERRDGQCEHGHRCSARSPCKIFQFFARMASKEIASSANPVSLWLTGQGWPWL